MKIYTASSWRNEYYQGVVDWLKSDGHEVYDFRNTISTPGKSKAFNWEKIAINWENWTPEEFAHSIKNPLAQNAFKSDYEGMIKSDACVLILPCGRSSHIEAGYMKGLGKKLYIYMPVKERPELTYSIADGIYTHIMELSKRLKGDSIV